MNRKSVMYLFLVVAVMLLVFLLGSFGSAGAANGSLPGSNFEIDNDANLKVDYDPPSIDWLVGGAGSALLTDVVVKNDVESGANDDSFKGGVKEDTEPPILSFGSIPPQKSDLKQFGTYVEGNDFLHMFWTRVQDPSGTTLMDFEFNKNKCDPDDPDGSVCSTNGVTPVRSVGDLLIVYKLAGGGTVAELFLHRWLGSDAGKAECEAKNSGPCWGKEVALNNSGDAIGSINSSFIPADETGGLNPAGLDPRTFGEASVDLSAIFNPLVCESFGSAYLKSRSSDSFTAQPKDFIAPTPVNLSNCGTVITRKVTYPSPDPTLESFNFTNNLLVDPADPSVQSFSLLNGESEIINDVLTGSYHVTESAPPSYFTLTDIDCSASDIPVTTILINRKVEFTLGVGETVDCTFTNTLAPSSITIVKNTIGGYGTFNFTSSALGDFDLTTTEVINPASTQFGGLYPETYDVAETVPAGWDLTSATCDEGKSLPDIVLGPGEDVTCTFTNTKRGQIFVDKVTNPAGSTRSFDFTLSGGPKPENQTFSLTDTDPAYDSGAIKPGTYAVAETLPGGWTLDTATCTSASDPPDTPDNISLAPGEIVTCTFTNEIGAIQISKTAKNYTAGGMAPLGGATFEVRDAENVLVDIVVTDDENGKACVSGLVVGDTYKVTETIAPDGYRFDATPQYVVAAAAECNGAGTPAGVSFVNEPLSEIVITFNSLAGPGVTEAISVKCTGPDEYDSGEEGPLAHAESATFTDLEEGEYICTIVIDP